MSVTPAGKLGDRARNDAERGEAGRTIKNRGAKHRRASAQGKENQQEKKRKYQFEKIRKGYKANSDQNLKLPS